MDLFLILAVITVTIFAVVVANFIDNFDNFKTILGIGIPNCGVLVSKTFGSHYRPVSAELPSDNDVRNTAAW